MYDLADLLKKHRSTYYDYSSGEPQRFWLPKIIQLSMAILAAFFFHRISDGLLQALLAVYSILIGFSFSVLFHLISQPISETDAEAQSHEMELRRKRFNTLHQEIFYNVSFFIVSSLLIVSLVIAYYILSGISVNVASSDQVDSPMHSLLGVLQFIGIFSFASILYFLLLETGFAFLRIVQRVIFYFNQKIEHRL